MAGEFRVGDRVKVTIEGEVNRVLAHGDGTELRITTGEDQDHYVYADGANVEKVEPEYETFGPGDIVRNKHFPGLVYVLGSDGNFAVPFDEWRPGSEEFTSERFERVTLA